MKLNKYYELIDRSAAKVAALILHPTYTWSYLEGIWRFKPAWTSSAKTRVSKLWKDQSRHWIDRTGSHLRFGPVNLTRDPVQ
jgi:predicted oxidoreductase